MILNSTHRNMLISSVRNIAGKVELYEGSTLLNTFNHTDALKSFTVERVGDSTKFFGYGVSQKVNVKLVDINRLINVHNDQNLKFSFITNKSTVSPTPRFYITDIRRDENTNELSITGYDFIYKAQNHTFAELGLEAPYTIMDVVSAIVGLLGVSFSFNVKTRDAFNIEYPDGANFEGTETLREVLDAIAEATQTIYYVNNSNALTFRHLDLDGAPVLTIRKDDYITLQSRNNRRLSAICSATELGDNVTASLEVSGTTQYVRDNPFWDLREDITTLLDNALTIVGGLTINQFECEWRGNYLVEPGDKIALTTKDNNTVVSYLLNEQYTYDGSIKAKTIWKYDGDDSETASNPSTLGDILKQTYARVDKANKQIDLVVSEVSGYTEAISSLQLTTDNITASVGDLNNDIGELSERVNASITSEELSIEVQKSLTGGVDKVTTTTGFTFNENGLNVSKTGSEMTTQITEDGMTVSRDKNAVLTADNTGVKAENLHATTYLIVGVNSRFENYDNGSRTGCFWIGG